MIVRWGRPRAVRALTISPRDRALRIVGEYPEGVERPITRADCSNVPRPCPFVSCRHHLYLDVVDFTSIKLNFPDLTPDELEASCSLDVADQGGQKLEGVGERMNITRERVRQMETMALQKVRLRGGAPLRDVASEGP